MTTLQRGDASLWTRGMIAVLIAQFLSASADNALLFAALAALGVGAAETGVQAVVRLQRIADAGWMVLFPVVQDGIKPGIARLMLVLGKIAAMEPLTVQNSISDAELRDLVPLLRRFALSLTREPSAADDLVQNTLERALTRWQSREPAASLKSWLFTILYRQFIDGRRRASRMHRLMEMFGQEEEITEPSPEEVLIPATALEAFSRLSPDYRAILLMVTVEGLSYQETANALQVPIGTVMSRLSRARQAYRALTEGETPTPALRRVK